MNYPTPSRLWNSAALALLALFAQPVMAQTLKPGLWEINNKMQSGSGQVEKAMADMQKQMASMPPDQRKMMQDMMAKQGMSMAPGAGGMVVKVCMTKESIERNELPSQQGDCKTTTTPRMGNTMKMSFVCTQPPSSGEGQVTFVSPEAYTMKMAMKTSVQGKPETMTMDGGGKWLSADCGNIKPMAVPKK
ncbi:DUF3617 domain-containing protein [Polaromonas sp. A23]|uniref:DUF3617 domain-containing protein n=1 Tax=Polaromonas sp. A23 TaxID=1944133 RepID=UPI0009857306|nr:DUF3617 domain-containing protein [Polaromonas sp. A23]OOG45128.1 hypothetical protein B0B52_05185 [Polaromonas sp. A23]